ncbi:MAG: protein kinase [Pseudomonadaceae bacterium]|nr:protein kinase [Pseudomonadaceae bacterium]
MTGPQDDRLKTGGAFAALTKDHTFDLESKLQGRILGGYRIGHVLGVGGMGYVLHGTRAEGDFDRVAAIKVVEVTHHRSDFAQRFRREVQILAQLNHPCIAQLYDAGETDDGWPYLVMEYVDGSPLDEYCEDNNLSIKARVELLIDVIEAVQFAHAQLIVHRDLKPSNVLVDKNGNLKLLDFGIAMLLGDKPEDVTQAGAMTLQYASPEQLLGNPISIATDVYQLGMLMCKVLGGHLPTDGETMAEAIQRSAERRLITVPALLRQTLPRELVLIIEQCLRNEPADRYADAHSLHDDLIAYLSGYPVSAVGASPTYRIQKFARRNWASVLSASTALMALVAATIIAAVQMLEANRQRDIAVYQQQRVQASSEFYSLLMEEMGRGSFTSVDLLDRGKALLNDQFGSGQPFMASVLFDVSRSYANLGEQDRESEMLREAETIARSNEDNNLLAAILCSMARNNLVRAPDIAAAQRSEGVELFQSLQNPAIETSMECLRTQADVNIKAGDSNAALEYLFAAEQTLDAHPAPANNQRGLVLNDIASAYFYDGRFDEAIHYLNRVLELLESSGRSGTLGYQRIVANKAVTLQSSGRTSEALETFVKLIERMRASGFQGRGAGILMTQYGDLLMSVGRVTDAEKIYREGLDVAESAGNSRITAALNNGLAKVYLARQAYPKASAHLDTAQAYIRDGEPRPLWISIRNHRVKLYRLTGQLELATAGIEALLTELNYPDSRRGPGLFAALTEGAEVYRQLGDYDKAGKLVDGLVARLRENMQDKKGNFDLGNALLLRAEINLAKGQPNIAEADLNEALPQLVYTLGEDHLSVQKTRDLLAELHTPG